MRGLRIGAPIIATSPCIFSKMDNGCKQLKPHCFNRATLGVVQEEVREEKGVGARGVKSSVVHST